MESETESQALAPTRSSLEDFVYDWYIQIQARFLDDSVDTTREMQAAFYSYMENSIVELCSELKSKLKREDIQLWPQMLVDVKEKEKENDGGHTRYWLLGLPVLEKQELGNAKKIVKDWREGAQREGQGDWEGKRRVKAVFIPRKFLLQQDLREDGDFSEVQFDGFFIKGEEKTKTREEPRREKESFKKKTGNPGDIRRQFMQHMVGSNSVSISGKLRPAKDVLKRLKYDPEYDEKDYVVGYINQKAGIIEVGVGKLDEREPEGNIAYFKEVKGGRIVWDRVGKVDLIFGV